jgi:hypothetical protein
MDAQDVAKALTLTQIAQMIVSLGTAIQNAVIAGKDSVTPDELAASFADKDAALFALAASIAQAKAEGR